MTTYFNEQDLVSFGEYLFSNERKQSLIESYNQKIKDGLEPIPYDETIEVVYHADVENWKETVED